MAALYLIRHGQASFGKADYDQLSAKGCQQAEILGQFWQNFPAADKYYAGDLLRHGQTAEHFFSGLQYADNQQPHLPVITHSGLNELDHIDVLSRYNSEWQDCQKMSEKIAKMPEANKVFQQEFTQAMLRWISGEFDSEYIESWQQFKLRCVKTLKEIISQQMQVNSTATAAKNIIIFTSGGPISAIIQDILALGDQQALAICQQLVNTGVTKLLFSKQHLNIDYINNYSHLTLKGSEWQTYR